MTGPSCYRFATPAQKRACLATGLAETLLLGPAGGAPVPDLAASGIRLIAAAPDGALFVIDSDGRLSAGGECGPVIADARRLAVGRDAIWVLADDGLHKFDRSTLQRLFTRDDGGAIDVAASADGGYWRLRHGRIDRFSGDGRRIGKALRTGWSAKAIAAVGDTLFLLSRDSERLGLLDPGDGRGVEIDLYRLLESAGAGFGAGPDGFGEAELVQGHGRLLLWRKRLDGWPEYLVLDAEGSVTARGRGEDGRPIETIALAGDDLVAALAGGAALLRFAGAAAGGGARWLTPAMEIGSHVEGWLRAEVLASLPEGATLSLRWAALPDEALRRSVEAVQSDRSLAAGDRLAAAAELLGPYWSPEFSYTGEPDEDGAGTARRLDFPLDKEAGPFLWIYLKLRRNDAARAPAIDSLTVYHGPERLIDRLPAIYRGDGDGDGTLRRLVGVMEATTHGIDRAIAQLAARLDPRRTEARWLPGLAAMLGLPFDEALTPDMQRGLIGAAGALLAGRGTRGGLAALFEALFPDRTVRILDRSTQFVPVALGGGGFEGGRLPALLTGPSRRTPRLNARLVLGGTPLSRPGGDGLIAPMPEVLVSIPATGGERRRFETAIRQMAEAMVPAGVRLRLRWLPWRRRPSGSPGDWLAVVDDPPPLAIGDGRLGRATVGGRRDARADSTPLGPTGHKLL